MNDLGTVRLETERLILRKGTSVDSKELFENCSSDDKITRYVVWNTHKTLDQTIEFLNKWQDSYDAEHSYKWLVTLKESREIIGTITVVSRSLIHKTCEIGYAYGSKYWNKGYATEALKEVIRFLCKDVGFETVYAYYLKDNEASGRIMIKAGMKYEGTARSRMIDKISGERLDLVQYSILKEEVI